MTVEESDLPEFCSRHRLSPISVLALNTHRVSKVQDNKGAVGHARLAEEGVWLAAQVLVVQLLHPALI